MKTLHTPKSQLFSKAYTSQPECGIVRLDNTMWIGVV